MPAYGYEFYLLVVNSISHSFAALTREISSWPLEDKIHIHARACNILYIFVTVIDVRFYNYYQYIQLHSSHCLGRFAKNVKISRISLAAVILDDINAS